jgi:GxxExxY protein
MDTKDRRFLRPNPTSEQIIKCALEVHSALGAGMLESAISACMLYEMTNAGLHIDHQVRLPIAYKGLEISAAYRIDFIVEKCVLLEIKLRSCCPLMLPSCSHI